MKNNKIKSLQNFAINTKEMSYIKGGYSILVTDGYPNNCGPDI